MGFCKCDRSLREPTWFCYSPSMVDFGIPGLVPFEGSFFWWCFSDSHTSFFVFLKT